MAEPSDAPPRGVRLATIGSVPVYLGWSWLLLGLIIVVIMGPPTAARFGPVTGYGIAAAYAVALLLSVLAHEAAHAFAARAFGHRVHRVVADLWGGHTAFDATHGTAWTAAAIAVVGPLANALIGLLAFVGAVLSGSPVVVTLLGGVAFVNGALALFNLLPGLPLDGGQVVESLVWAATGDQSRARIIAGWAGRVLVMVIVALIIGLPLLRGSSPQLTTTLWTALIGAFLWSGASAAISQGRAMGTIRGLDVASVLEPAAAIPADAPVAELTSLRALPVVVDGAGRPFGLIDHDALRSVPPEAVGSTPVSAVTTPAPEGWSTELHAGREAMDLVVAFQTSRSGIVAVTDQGVLRGVARAQRVNAALARN
ncbi:MAG TPA: site-2 protease family protein [Candidatus Janibacter merdipullorum]|nr:site-2 protease family protein [Candidatus Janibacter merdipullorum]